MSEQEGREASPSQDSAVLPGFFAGILIAAISLGVLVLGGVIHVSSRCPEFVEHGYLEVSRSGRAGRALEYLEEFRQKSGYQPAVHLLASPFDEAYSWQSPCNPNEQTIVIYIKTLNEWNDDELRGLVGHEFGHKLVDRHSEWDKLPPKTSKGMRDLKERQQLEADGYAIEVAGEASVFELNRKLGWDDKGARKQIAMAKKALADLRKRLPVQ